MLHMHIHPIGQRSGSGASMRRIALLTSLVLLPGCTGFGTFLDHTFSSPYDNPNIPMADSENIRRAVGGISTVEPLQPEAGNVWPAPQGPEPTLADLQNGGGENQRGFAPTTVPGAEPGLPAGRQPRPVGSSTPPGSNQPGAATPSSIAPIPPPRSSAPGPGPQGQIIQTPRGPAVDAGGTSGYRQLTTPQGPGAIMVPNGNGTSTIINPNGSIQTVPTPR
jgi:hypothetical protein